MRLLVSWVRDFVDVTASPEEIAEKLSMRGFEVASIEQMPEQMPEPLAEVFQPAKLKPVLTKVFALSAVDALAVSGLMVPLAPLPLKVTV